MNNITLKSLVLVSSIISVMSLEDLFSSSHFNGPVFDPDSISWAIDSNSSICDCCDGCTK